MSLKTQLNVPLTQNYNKKKI